MAAKKKSSEPAAEAAEAAAPAAGGKTVELADKDTGFFDPATGFQLVRDQTAKLDKAVGDATRVALESGRLLIVGK